MDQFQCECLDYWKGPICTEPDPCSPDPCANGVCAENSNGGFDCECEPGKLTIFAVNFQRESDQDQKIKKR
jgi:hypothetical protein